LLGCLLFAGMLLFSVGTEGSVDSKLPDASQELDASASPAMSKPAPAPDPKDGKLRIICFGAHPDDNEFCAGGVAAMWASRGHRVKFVSCTNGNIGHWGTAGGPLAQRRTTEVRRCAEIFGIETEVLDVHDGELMPTLENRKTMVRLIRPWGADVVMCHRTNDYHPDHRNVALLVQDAGYMVTVPFFCPDIPYLRRNPVFLYYEDHFQRPYPFTADVVVGIDEGIEHPALTLSRALISAEGGAQSDARGAPNPVRAPDLALIRDLWPKLPEHIRAAIKTLVQAYASSNKQEHQA